MGLLHLILTSLLAQSAPARLSDSDRVLRTQFTSTVSVPASTSGSETFLWIPIPSENEYQAITGLSINGTSRFSITQEKKYRNNMVFAQLDGGSAHEIIVTYVVERRQATSKKIYDDRHNNDTNFLSADTLVPIGGAYAELAQEIAGKELSKIAKARAVFQHVIATMQYDYKKESPRLGQGDVAFVCDYKKGNCSDLHSYLISILRTLGIPAYLEFGFPIAGIPIGETTPKSGAISGYHCWTWIKLKDEWLPLDASDARRWLDSGFKDKVEFLFGNLVLERSAVAVSRGRDIVLSPPQSGQPLNNFIYPYAESRGNSIEVVWKMKYESLD